VVDVEQAIEDARRVATEAAAASPDLAPLVEEGLAAAEAAGKAATASAASAGAEAASAAQRQTAMQVAGRRVEIAVTQDGKVVGKAHATLNLDRTLRSAFAFSRRDQGEIPFAIDLTGVVHNPDPADRRTLESFGVAALGPAATDGRPRRAGDWLIVSRKEPSGLIFGIARPIGEWDMALFGAHAHRWLLFGNAGPAIGLAALLFGVRRLRPLVAGVALGSAAFLGQVALAADVAFPLGATALRAWAVGNALVCLWLARVSGDQKP